MKQGNTYMVEFDSGRSIYVYQYTLDQVIQYCKLAYQNDPIKSIFLEVFVNTEELENV